MTELAQLQTDFQQYILSNEACMENHVVGTQKVSVQTRLAIYANAYRYRLIDILFEDYEKLAILLGDEQFVECALAYIDAYPSSFSSVRWFGQHLPTFLKNTDPYKDQPFLAEIAQFEWGLMNTFDAPDHTSVTLETLSNIPPDQWAAMAFTLTPSFHKISVEWNTLSVWQALNEEKEPPEPCKLVSSQTWMLWRKALEPHYRSLSMEETWAIDQAIAGILFGDICEGLCEWMDESEVGIQAASFLKTWVTEALITEIILRE